MGVCDHEGVAMWGCCPEGMKKALIRRTCSMILD